MGHESSRNQSDSGWPQLEGLAIALETASYVANLISTNPDGGDARSTADDHLRLIKAALTRTFPKLDAAVSLSAAQIAYLNDVSASVQSQLNTLRDGSATANAALYANSASFATRASHAASASFATVAATANSASYAAFAGQAASASFAALARTANSASFATFAGSATSASFATNSAHARSASFATTAANATTATNATNAETAQNSVLFQGFGLTIEATAGSTVVLRNSSGHVFATLLNQTSSQTMGTPDNVIVTLGNNYFQKVAPSTLGAVMEARNISNRSGTTKTLSTSTPSGGSNGDIWYRYA